MKWYTKLDLEKAIKQIIENEKMGKDFFLDPLRFEDLTIPDVKEELIKFAFEKIEKNSSAKPLLKIDVPKKNYILRPGSRPHLIDWIIYEAVVNFIIMKSKNKIQLESFSFDKFIGGLTSKSKVRSLDYWVKFEDFAIELSKKYPLLLVTDITSFYENVSLEILKQRLLSFCDDDDYIKAVDYLLDKLLFPWSKLERAEGFSLPQGPNASSALADVYLYSVDRAMKQNREAIMFRYMDDIRIFSTSKSKLKNTMKILVKGLRGLKLNLNDKKTNIYSTNPPSNLDKVFDPNKKILDLIDKAIKSGSADQIDLVVESLFELYHISKDSNNNFNERYLKFFLARIIDLMSLGKISKKTVKVLVIDMLESLDSKHHLTDKVSWFLLCAMQFDSSNKEVIFKYLFNFIKDKTRNIYDWQEMWILDVIRQIGGLNQREIAFIRKRKSLLPCLGQVNMMLGLNNRTDDRDVLIKEIERLDKDDDRVRYIISALQIPLKKGSLKSVEFKIPNYLLTYLSRLKHPKYGYRTVLSRRSLTEKVQPFTTVGDIFGY